MLTNENTNNDNEHFLISFILQMMQNIKSYINVKTKKLI